MGKGSGSGLTRGDRRRNARIERLRGLVPAANAVLGVDLGEKKQALALVDGDGRVIMKAAPWSWYESVWCCGSVPCERALERGCLAGAGGGRGGVHGRAGRVLRGE